MSFTNLDSLNDIENFSNMTFTALFEMKSNAMLYLINSADVPSIKQMYNPQNRSFRMAVSFQEEIDDILISPVVYNINSQIDQTFTPDQVEGKIMDFTKKLIEGMRQIDEVPMRSRKDINYNVLLSLAFHKIFEKLTADEKTQEAIMLHGFDQGLIDAIHVIKWSLDYDTPLVEMDDEQDLSGDEPAPTSKIEVTPL